MRLLTAIVLLTLAAALPLRAQSDSDWVQESEPVQRGGGGIVGFGGGVSGTWMFTDLSAMDMVHRDRFIGATFPTIPQKGLFLFGGHGYVYTVIVPNLRIGGMGLGASAQVSDRVDGKYRSTQFSTSFGGLTLDYVIPIKRLHITFGGMLGWGHRTFVLTWTGDIPKDWNDVFSMSGSVRHELTQRLFVYQPAVSLEYEIHPLAVLSLTGGWSGSRAGTWQLDNAFDVIPEPEFKFDNAFVRLGLTVGFFLPE